MRNKRPFAAFARRVAVGYLFLAVVLILAVVAVSSVLAVMLYVGSINEAVQSSLHRAQELSRQYQSQGLALEQYAPQIVDAVSRTKVRVFVVDDAQQLIAGQVPPRGFLGPPRGVHAFAAMLGLRPGFARVTGGTIVVLPDFSDLSAFFERYVAVVVPVGLAAMVLAWFVGARITARAIAPLADVTLALRRIAGGDFAPEPLLERNAELHDLTAAYNEVAYRLTAATAERERNELQMRQFIADAGHELRTPLTVIMGYLEMLQQGAVSDPAGIERVQTTMLAESRRMRAVIEKLIFLARLERPDAPRETRFDVVATAKRVANALEPLAGAGRIAFSSEGAAEAIGDENELYEAFKNVVENAVRYAPQSPVELRVARRDGSVQVVVADRGPGMTPDERDHAFDRFYRGRAPSAGGDPIEGSGLGLAIAKRALERAGGTIDLQSAPGEGTRVVMSLPLAG